MKTLVALVLWLPSAVFACLELGGDENPGETATRTGGDNRVALDLRRSIDLNPHKLTAQSKFGDAKTEAQKKQAEAVNKIFAGDLEAAITLLTKIESQSPGQHSTAVNLGTAYELKGDNANALKWIKAGIDRNAGSDHGTEWLHALILEAKIEAAKDPDHPLITHLLWVPEKMGTGTPVLAHGQTYSVLGIRTALSYQLRERLVFVKPKDPFVADLLYSYALIEGNLSAVENGLGLLQLAREYGFPNEELLKQQEHRFQSVVRNQRAKSLALILLNIAIMIQVAGYCWRRKELFLHYLDFRDSKHAPASPVETTD